jgi:S-(hydroxymethyl)glutathione dehydrogenase/alcohol dehydrogenase
MSVGGGAFTDASGKTINSGPISTFAERAIVSEDRVTPIRKDMPLDLAALLGCAVATGAGAVYNTAAVKPGEKVVVFGAGGIGLNAIQAAALSGASQIIAVDVHPHKLDQAKRFGATHVIDARTQPAAAAVQQLTGKGADVAIESAGQRATMEAAFQSVRQGGGRAVLVGNLPAGHAIEIDPFQLICGKQILGSWGGGTQPARDIPRYVDLFLEGKLKLQELVSHRFPLDRINDGLEALEKGEVNRALLTF